MRVPKSVVLLSYNLFRLKYTENRIVWKLPKGLHKYGVTPLAQKLAFIAPLLVLTELYSPINHSILSKQLVTYILSPCDT